MAQAMRHPEWSAQLPNNVMRIILALKQEGHKAWVVGGAVRDWLLGITPTDFDLVTSATPEEVTNLFTRTVNVGERFGVTIVIEDGEAVEVATFRKDGSYLDSRHPDSVSFADPEADANRRDFTMNGLFWNPENGEIIDYVDGISDINARKIRTIGRASQRFKEDALRTVRALRFLSQLAEFNFELDENLFNGIKRQGHLILEISQERVTEELEKILTSHKPSIALQLMRDTKLFDRIFPDLRAFTGDAFSQMLATADGIKSSWRKLAQGAATCPLPLHWACLFYRCPDPMRVMRKSSRVMISKKDMKVIHAIIRNRKNLKIADTLPISRLKPLLASDVFFHAIALIQAENGGRSTDVDKFALDHRKKFIEAGTLDPEPLITGADLQKMGIEPGPQFKDILESIRTEQLEERIHSREDAVSYVRSNYMQDSKA